MSVRTTTLDASIVGDEQEIHRIQLERNLQHTDISLHLSSNQEDSSDVEFPRHLSNPHSFSALASFEYPSRDAIPLNGQPWSYRTMEDDDGTHPFAGETISTAAHHASALTFSAGLGGRGPRRDISLSGAEYDPERPVQVIVDGFNPTNSSQGNRKQAHISSTVDFDPLVVDDTVEIDNIISACRSRSISAIRSPSPSSSSTSSHSDRAPSPRSPRPRLADALQRGPFSPQRPKASALPNVSRRSNLKQTVVSTSSKSYVDHQSIYNRSGQSLSYAAHPLSNEIRAQPEVHVEPPTPRGADRTITFASQQKPSRVSIHSSREAQPRSAKSSNRVPRDKDRDSIQQQATTSRSQKAYFAEESSRPFAPDMTVNSSRITYSNTPGSKLRSRVHLPDVTGLTSAVGSPARITREMKGYEVGNDRDVDARIITTLTIVQARLTQLECENSISRRRVHELELELEECKKDVAKERTRVLEQERSRAMRASPRRGGSTPKRGGELQKEKAGEEKKLEEAVAETKALEALIATLRTHLSRLTSELSDHRKLLGELRALRDVDVRALKEKSTDVDKLRREVERLGGEVEVLRGVVEEGLKERREGRGLEEGISESSRHDEEDASVLKSVEKDHSEEEEEEEDEEQHLEASMLQSRASEVHVEESVGSKRSASPTGISHTTQTRSRQARIATPCPPQLEDQQSAAADLFISREELQRIEQEVEERRSERSIASAMANRSKPHGSLSASTSSTRSSISGSSRVAVENAPPVNLNGKDGSSAVNQPVHAVGVPHGEDVATKNPGSAPSPSANTNLAAPFPQIRGSRLERLFFSAHDHDHQTCSACFRRQSSRARHGHGGDVHNWVQQQHNKHAIPMVVKENPRNEDEGFAEGSELGSTKAGNVGLEKDQRLPPATVLSRVLRELEDDFSHYKSIYVELADQYKVIDAASNVVKRNVLARHLQDVVDILEQKGDQIASLYDLLNFRDKPTE